MVRSIARLAFAFLPFVMLACGGSAAVDPLPGDDATDGTVVGESEVAGRPSYTTRSAAIRGEYTANDGCPGGFEACYFLDVRRGEGGLEVQFGKYGDYVATKTWTDHGVVLFTTEEGIDNDCDYPGCGNMLQISGVIYPVKRGGVWVPQVKATFVSEFLHPEEAGDPAGEVRTTIRFTKD